MNRRDFMVAASGVAGATAAAAVATAGTPVAAQEDDADGDPDEDADTDENGGEENGEEETDDAEGEEENGNGAANGGGTETVEVGDNYFEPEEVVIEPGTTVVWEWVGDIGHNVEPTSQPDDTDWEGQPELWEDGEYEHTFDTEGTYEYTCTPHQGMDGVVEVTEDADEVAAEADVDIDEIGVPIQKHYVGIATFLAIFVSIVFNFYLLKYGESAHTSSPGRD